MLKLLKQIESISSCRDRELLEAGAVTAIHELLQPCRVSLMRFVPTPAGPGAATAVHVDEDGLCVFGHPGAEGAPAVPLASDPLLLQAYRDVQPFEASNAEGFVGIYPLCDLRGSTPIGAIRLERPRAPGAMESEAVARFLHFYCNYLGLLDYSELDTLTGLLNRKTFDESFDRLLSRSPASPEERQRSGERRLLGDPERRHWLAVVDIDHFKRVNDGFGHLFGDEVLLRVANLMRGSFRNDDKLFRFGGEEFVVMLRVGSRDNARAALERLRHRVEEHEFPQVGQVTCSIGFTAVDANLAPTDILGQADEALYYAKEHGRNQVCCYEALIETGQLAQPSIEAHQAEIDALFG